MRDIKFRTWYGPDKDTKDGPLKFFQDKISDRLYFTMEKDYEIGYAFDIPFLDNDWIVEQYTGLKDKNGKEIYEGDIVAKKHDGSEGEANVGKVFFAAGTFMIDGDGTLYEYTHSLTPDVLEDYIVVGNIHENPELLK